MRAVILIPLGLLCLWGIVYWPCTSTVVNEIGIICRGPFRSRRLPWADVVSWRIDVDSDTARQTLVIRMRSKLFGVSFDEWRVARPGFDRFLEVVRQHVGDKERPRPSANV